MNNGACVLLRQWRVSVHVLRLRVLAKGVRQAQVWPSRLHFERIFRQRLIHDLFCIVVEKDLSHCDVLPATQSLYGGTLRYHLSCAGQYLSDWRKPASRDDTFYWPVRSAQTRGRALRVELLRALRSLRRSCATCVLWICVSSRRRRGYRQQRHCPSHMIVRFFCVVLALASIACRQPFGLSR